MTREILLIIVLSVSLSASANEESADEITKKIQFSGAASLEFGQLVNAKWRTIELDTRPWLSRAQINLGFDATIRERLNISINAEGEAWYDTYSADKNDDNNKTRYSPQHLFYINQGSGTYSFGDLDLPYLQVSAGIFLFKYNLASRNFGEYLFRSGVYPGYLTTNFDFACSRLSGIHLHSTLFESFEQDLLFTTERDLFPLHDFSLTYLVHYTVAKAARIGIGGSLWRILPITKEMTTPDDAKNMYFSNPKLKDTVLVLYDPFYDDTLWDSASTLEQDTGFYTFQGIKLGMDFQFDIKKLFPDRFSIFGDQDLILYGEAAILGLKDYPDIYTYAAVFDTTTLKWKLRKTLTKTMNYDDIIDRIPVMVGFNFPTFKLLDVLSLEAEYYTSKNKNVYFHFVRADDIPLPQPEEPFGIFNEEIYAEEDNLKWSVYAKKTITDGFSLIGQVAKDHWRHRIERKENRDIEEALVKKNSWYWMFKILYSF